MGKIFQHKREPLTTTEQERFINSCSTQEEKLICITLLESGLREAELVSLKKDNIQWQRESIVIWGKGNKRRMVPLSAKAKMLLENYYMFNNELRLSLSKVYRTVRKVAERAKITKKVSPHVLRHTFAVNTLSKGVSIVALQKILGHENLETTMIYLNMSNEGALDEFRRKVS